MDVEYEVKRSLKTSHLPDLNQDQLDPEGAAAHNKIGRQPLCFQMPSYSATVKPRPLQCFPPLTPPSPVRMNIDDDSQQEYVETEAPGEAPIPPGGL